MASWRRMTRRPSRAGISLLDVLVAMTVLVVAIAGLASSLVSTLRLSRVNEETALADDAARALAARIRGSDFRDIFALYNATPVDDPLATPAPGPDFDVPGLDARTNDADGFVGRVLFPVGPGETLREDAVDASLGMPRDLDGDGVVDAADHSGDYVLLPVTIRLDWRGPAGKRFLELDLLLIDG